MSKIKCKVINSKLKACKDYSEYIEIRFDRDNENTIFRNYTERLAEAIRENYCDFNFCPYCGVKLKERDE